MELFNNIIERKADGSSRIVNYDIILSEYARKKDLANYLHKGRNKTNILHSHIDMGNNKTTNLGNPGSAKDTVLERFTSYGVYISQLIRFARVSSHVVDFNALNKSLTAKLLQQGYRYHKLRKTFSKFYRRHYELVSKFSVGLKTLLHQGLFLICSEKLSSVTNVLDIT